MNLQFLKLLALVTLVVLCGCETFHRGAAMDNTTVATTGTKTPDPAVRNNSLALLNNLLSEEKNLSKILIIKRESPDFKWLVKEISQTAATGVKRLKAMAKREGLQLENIALPPGEQAARKAISKTREKLLLQSKTAEFEVQLLLTQVEALNYGSHLAMVVAENESRPDVSREFSALSVRLKQLQDRAIAMLRMKD